jgi:hypothetical protein
MAKMLRPPAFPPDVLKWLDDTSAAEWTPAHHRVWGLYCATRREVILLESGDDLAALFRGEWLTLNE